MEVTAGPDAGVAKEFDSTTIRVGSRSVNDLVLTDRRVSGMHFEVRLTKDGYRIRDLESTNGTFVSGVRVNDAYLRPGATIGLGKSALRFVPLADSVEVPLFSGGQLGQLVGYSPQMRRLFAQVERVAAGNSTVLITGETGTGKELVATAVHDASPRSAGPFVVFDCSSTPGNLFEDALFGHERGAFTGAEAASAGAFERARGGTLFLDEIGELPMPLQPKLLRVLESKQVSRIGGSKPISCDVRFVAATNRDLAVELNRGTFRGDLYYRLAVAELHLPPLRERREDIRPLIEHFLARLPGACGAGLPAEVVSQMLEHSWPGNVRELRNAVERAVVLPQHPLRVVPRPATSPAEPSVGLSIDVDVPFKLAKQQFVDEFDRRFMTALLERHDWNIAAAARATGVDRVSIYKLLERLSLRRP
ncbi:MAG: sigma 54-dependent Fis family transcriptional regulator [Deltaproteobacteria bacterium]|nr:sigma 54-dependent Fis family transcriptional regulator [Deltaproteobacteria bacterium]